MTFKTLGLREHVHANNPTNLPIEHLSFPPTGGTMRVAFTLDGEQYQTLEMIDCGLGEVCIAADIEYFKSGASRSPHEAALDKRNIYFHMHDAMS